MTGGIFCTPLPTNEPVKLYAPGSPERASVRSELERQSREELEIPLVIGGEEVRTGRTSAIVMPHLKNHRLGVFHKAGAKEIARAIDAAWKARGAWERMPWEERAAVFLRAAELLSTTWRDRVNAATMLGQSKTVHQAEVDAACELIDFFRFNVRFAERLYSEQPDSAPGCWNRLEYRPLDGFVFAITPFNFTSIGGNLPSAPALMGNTVVWKPASTSVLSNYYLMKLFEAAGVPPGVINFVPGNAAEVGDPVIADSRLGGVHFTGSTGVFQSIWNTIGQRIERYSQYPRLVGETGGKDFIFAHPSADREALVTALIRGAFEYQGQKCSAASRAYVPSGMWPQLRERVVNELAQVKVGDVRDFSNFMGAVIDGASYEKQKKAIEGARRSGGKAEIVSGGECDDRSGWFVQPTVIQAHDPRYDTMRTELFGPVLTLHVYDERDVRGALELCATGSEYALTGAIFAEDRSAIREATDALRFAAGNFYVNDKPTGAVVGQQPFGGSRASGTNDKAGSILNLFRWVSARTIKETFAPPTDWRYPFLSAP